MSGRRKLRDLNLVLALLLDLIVAARAVRFRTVARTAHGDGAVPLLRKSFGAAANELREGAGLNVAPIGLAARGLRTADPLLRDPVAEIGSILGQLAEALARLRGADGQSVDRRKMAHPDAAGLRRAVARGALAVCIAGLAWVAFDWDPLRYLMLGTCIFTVLFSAADEPAPALRQVFLGGLCAAVAALLWSEAVVPHVASGWVSLGLAVPVVLSAATLQAIRGTAFMGLAFNMIFAVLARPVDVMPGTPIGLVGVEAMLLSGIALSYGSFRWLIPMDVARRRDHLRTSMRREVAAISIRSGAPLAERHLARLRYLVLGVAVRARGDVASVEDALAALAFGHIILRLGEMTASSASRAARGHVSEALRLAAEPIDDARALAREFRRIVARNGADDRTTWLLELAAHELESNPSSFERSPQ